MRKVTLWKGTKRHEKARKGTKRHERAQVGRHILSEYAPNHVAIWLLQPDCRLKTCWKFTSSYLVGKKAVFLIWQFPGMPPSQEGVGHAWRFLILRREKQRKTWNFGENLVKIGWKFGPISSASSAFWILSSISSRIWCYFVFWERKKSKFVKKEAKFFSTKIVIFSDFTT